MNTGTGIASDLRLQILCILSCRHISRGIRFIFHIDFPCRLLSRERSDLLLCCRTHISGRQQPDLLFLLRQHHRNLDHRTILLKSILHIDHRSFSHTVIAIELVLSCRLVEDFRHLTGTLSQRKELLCCRHRVLIILVESVILRPESLLQTAELKHFPACRTSGIPSVINIPSLLLCKGMGILDPLGRIKFREIGARLKRYIRQLFRINIPFFLCPDSLIGILRITDIYRLVLCRRCSFRRKFFLTAVSSRITAQADDECCDHRHRTDEDPERRLTIIQHMADPVLHMILSEG